MQLSDDIKIDLSAIDLSAYTEDEIIQVQELCDLFGIPCILIEASHSSNQNNIQS